MSIENDPHDGINVTVHDFDPGQVRVHNHEPERVSRHVPQRRRLLEFEMEEVSDLAGYIYHMNDRVRRDDYIYHMNDRVRRDDIVDLNTPIRNSISSLPRRRRNSRTFFQNGRHQVGAMIFPTQLIAMIPDDYRYHSDFTLSRNILDGDGIVDAMINQGLQSTLSRNEHSKINVDVSECGDKLGETCSICQSEYTQKDKIGRLECKHIFHESCIKEWGKYKAECPECRHPIPLSGPSHGFERLDL